MEGNLVFMNKEKLAKIVRENIDVIEQDLDKYGGPFGAVIVDKDFNVVAAGWNTVTGTNDPTAHAEVNAIRNACKHLGTFDLSGYSIIATGYPCPMCLSAIMWANIKDVYFVSPVEEAERIGFRDEFIYETIEQLRNGKPCKAIHIEYADMPEQTERMKKIYTQYQQCGQKY